MSTRGVRDVWILLPPSYSDSDIRRTASFRHSQQRQDLVGWIFLDGNYCGGMNYSVSSPLFIKRILGISRNPISHSSCWEHLTTDVVMLLLPAKLGNEWCFLRWIHAGFLFHRDRVKIRWRGEIALPGWDQAVLALGGKWEVPVSGGMLSSWSVRTLAGVLWWEAE